VAQLASFLALSALVIVAPGPDMALVARNALLGGARGAALTSFAVVTGLAVWTLAASAGVAALLRASEPAFMALKVVGATYLVTSAYRRSAPPDGAMTARDCRRPVSPGGRCDRVSSAISALRRSPFSSRASCRSSRRPARRSSPSSAWASCSA
jgi:threonine/homoserine/homoserine lactone efflux protein